MFVPLAILIGSLVALLLPEPFIAAKPALRPAFCITMFAVGTLVSEREVRSLWSQPIRPLVGTVTQYTVMPLLAWATSFAFDDPMLKAGIVLVGCVPGAMASNVVTALAGGNLMLSVAMTTLATVICPLALGLWMPLLVGARLPLDATALALSATWMVVLPVCLGIGSRYLLTRRHDESSEGVVRRMTRVTRGATAIASSSIVLIVLVVVASNQDRLRSVGWAVGSAMLGLNLAAYSAAWTIGRSLRWNAADQRTLIIEVGMQNAGLGSVLATTHLGDRAALPAALYTALCVVTASAFIPLFRGRTAKDAPTPAIP